MTLATKLVVLKYGIVQQAGIPDQVYSQPANTFVAGFIGSPSMNLISVELVEGGNIRVYRGSADPIPLQSDRLFWMQMNL